MLRFVWVSHERSSRNVGRKEFQRQKPLLSMYQSWWRQSKCRLPQFRLDLVEAAFWEWICGFLTNPLVLEQGIQDFQTIQEGNNEQVFERITLIEELLEDNKKQLQRVLDLYLDGCFSKDLLLEKKTRLEHTIQSLQIENQVTNGHAVITGFFLNGR